MTTLRRSAGDVWPVLLCLMTVVGVRESKGGTTFYPGQGEYGTLLFEDQWPSRGDLDFNDAVLRYNYEVVTDADGKVEQFALTVKPAALGSTLNSGVGLRLPLPASTPMNATLAIGSAVVPISPDPSESDIVLWLTDDVRANLLGGAPGPINTEPALPVVDPPSLTLQVSFTGHELLAMWTASDLFIYRSGDRGHQIHQSSYYGTDAVDPSLYGTFDDVSDPPPGDGGSQWYVSAEGVPWALNIPVEVPNPAYREGTWPRERVRIDSAWPQIVGFFGSGGVTNTDWYLHPDARYLYAPVPEPTSLTLLVLAAAAGWCFRRGQSA